MRRSHKESDVSAEGLPHEGNPLNSKRVEHGHDIRGEGGGRNGPGEARAMSVAAEIRRDDATVPAKPGGRVSPFLRVSGQTVEQYRRWPSAAVIQSGKHDARPVDRKSSRCPEITAGRHRRAGYGNRALVNQPDPEQTRVDALPAPTRTPRPPFPRFAPRCGNREPRTPHLARDEEWSPR